MDDQQWDERPLKPNNGHYQSHILFLKWKMLQMKSFMSEARPIM